MTLADAQNNQSVVHTENDAVRALPSNVTFHNLIAKNKRKSVLLMLAMGLLVIVIGAVISSMLAIYATRGEAINLIPSAITGAVVASIIAIIACTWSFYGGANAILRIANAKEIEKVHDPQLFNVVEELSIAAGTPMPKVYLINDPAINAFATGRDPEHGAVAITTGLREQLTRDELAGVMAHELSHIRHYDIRFAMLMATMVGLIVFACDAFWRIMWHGALFGGGRRSSSRSKGGGAIVLVLMVVGILLAIIAPTLAMVIRMAVSREREYLADAGAVELTRYPQGLIGALEKLGSCKHPLKGANRATSHLFIVNPLKNALKGKGHELSSVLRTHPPLHDRIARLKALIQ